MANELDTELPKAVRKVSHFSTPVGDEELEFIKAIEEWKTRNVQRYPSWTEVFAVFKSLGYSKSDK